MTATQMIEGAIRFSNSSHFAPIANSKLPKPVILPPGRAKLATNPSADDIHENGAIPGLDLPKLRHDAARVVARLAA